MIRSTDNIYSVSQVTGYIQGMVEQEPLLQRICIKGEVSNCSYASSGHLYFTLKDKGAILSCAMWRSDRKRLTFPMKNGDQVIAKGEIGVYGPQGCYKLYAKEIQRQGEGYYHQEFERVKKKLGEEGIFDPGYKKPLPKYIRTLGVVTAPTGAVIDDIRSTAYERNPYVQIYLCPAQVQGDGAAQSLIHGLKALDRFGVDVIIIGRGGGSMEDMWAFNSEELGRAIFACQTPVISAVGHAPYEKTISDLVADGSAITPTAAAQMAVFSAEDFLESLSGLEGQAAQKMGQVIFRLRSRVQSDEKLLQSRSPRHLINERRQLLDDYARQLEGSLLAILRQQKDRAALSKARLEGQMQAKFAMDKRRLQDVHSRLDYSMDSNLKDWKAKEALCAQKLDAVSPLKQMQRGFAFVSDENGAGVRSVEKLEKQQPLTLHMADGKAKVRVEETVPAGGK